MTQENSEKRINAGYEIIDAIPVGNTEFVLGRNIHDGARYVTWECKNGDNYFWGHYFADRKDAVRDFYERAGREIRYNQLREERRCRTNEEREER